jgi:hypothetical protein
MANLMLGKAMKHIGLCNSKTYIPVKKEPNSSSIANYCMCTIPEVLRLFGYLAKIVQDYAT